MHSSTTNNLPIYVKVTYSGDTRMVGTTSAGFAELESQVRKSFGLGERYQLDLRYLDDEEDRVCLSSDEELRHALDSFQGKTLRLFLATKNVEESPNCPHKRADVEDSAKHQDAAQELKERLNKEGFDVPEWRCRKLVAKWNGNVDLAEEAALVWRQRKAARATDAELLSPPGCIHRHHGPHRHFGGHHGPHRHHFGGHHGPHHPHHQPHPHPHHHFGGSECEPKPGHHHFMGHRYNHGPHHGVHQLHPHHPRHQPLSSHHWSDEAECQPQPCGRHDHKWKKHHHPEHSRQIEALLLHRMAKRECAHQGLRCPKGHHGMGAGSHHSHGPRHCRGFGHGPHHPRPSFCAHPKPMPGFPLPGSRFHCFA